MKPSPIPGGDAWTLSTDEARVPQFRSLQPFPRPARRLKMASPVTRARAVMPVPVSENTEPVRSRGPAPMPRAPLPDVKTKEVGGLEVRHVVHSGRVAFLDPLIGDASRQSFEVKAGIFQTPGPSVKQRYVGKDDHIDDPSAHERGENAACGSAAVAATLARFGKFATTEGIDEHMRAAMKFGGSPLAGVQYLRDRGLEAEQHNGGSWADLKKGIEQGYGVIVSFSHSSSAHTVVVTGIFTDEKGQEYIEVQDWSGLPLPSVMTREQFELGWSAAALGGFGGLKTGISNTYVLVAAKGAPLPAGGSLWGELNASASHTLLDGFQAIVSGTAHIRSGEIMGGSSRIVGGLLEAMPLVPTGAVQLVGSVFELVADKGIALIHSAFGGSSFWAKLGAALLAALVYPLKVGGWIVRTAAQIAGAVVSAFARLLAKPFLALSGVLHSDNDACNQIRHCQVDGNEREKRNYQQLVHCPPEAKAELIRLMLNGHVGKDERAMVLRVLQAASDDQRAQVIALAGKVRLESAFKGIQEAMALARFMMMPVSSARPTRISVANPLVAATNPSPVLRVPSPRM